MGGVSAAIGLAATGDLLRELRVAELPNARTNAREQISASRSVTVAHRPVCTANMSGNHCLCPLHREQRHMKNRKSALASLAAAASLALVFSLSAPASAYEISGYHSCPNTAQVKVTIKTNLAGKIKWEKPLGVNASDSWIGTSYTRTLVYYARNLGDARWVIDNKFTVTATCVRL